MLLNLAITVLSTLALQASSLDSDSTVLAGANGGSGADPVVSDGDKYHVVLENARVRVLRYHDEPGAETHPHHHPEFLMYALGPFKRKLIAPDGSVRVREFKAGDVAWMSAQSHSGVNIGTTPTDALLVEFK